MKDRQPPRFERYVGIDYSGAGTPVSRQAGIRVFLAQGDDQPAEVRPSSDRSHHWTRRLLAEWLTERLLEPVPTLAGIDHSFSFPDAYFELHAIPRSWDTFLNDFCAHWPTDRDDITVENVRRGGSGGPVRHGNSRWRRIAEQRCGAKSVFHFDVPGSVAKSTHAGLPWLRRIRTATIGRVHFWPYDGWNTRTGCTVLAEVYPTLCREPQPDKRVTQDQRDAYAAARWLQLTDRDGMLEHYLRPVLSDDEVRVAVYEGWILGVR